MIISRSHPSCSPNAKLETRLSMVSEGQHRHGTCRPSVGQTDVGVVPRDICFIVQSGHNGVVKPCLTSMPLKINGTNGGFLAWPPGFTTPIPKEPN